MSDLMFTSPFYDDKFKLKYAKGMIDFNRRVITNLRAQILNLEGLAESCGVASEDIEAVQFKHLRKNYHD